jgi:AraC family transcriptional regulator
MPPRLIQQATEAHRERKSGFNLVPCLGEVDPIAEHALRTLKALLERRKEAKDTASSAEALVRLLADHLATTYGRGQREEDPLPGTLSRPKLRRVSEYVRARLSKDLTVEDMAAVVNISPHHFSRLFRATTGETPHQFVMRHRLEEAERLLLETDEPIAEVARQVGYQDASHFALIFRRRTGFAPRAYRRQHGA